MKTLSPAVFDLRAGFVRWAVMTFFVLASVTAATPLWGATSEAGLADAVKNLWRKIDEARLVNRTSDELVAWVIVGVGVGAVAGMLTPLKPTGVGKLGRLVLGLVGSFIGGVVVHVGQFDFGWGPVLIRYEELFFALVGAVVLVVIGRFFGGKAAKKQKAER